MSQHERIIRLPEVKEKVGLSTASIYRQIRDGEFPKQVKLGKHASGWIESDIQAWIMKRAGREAENDSGQRAA